MEKNILHNVTFNELAIGQTASVSRVLTKKDIDLFAVVSGDTDKLLHHSQED